MNLVGTSIFFKKFVLTYLRIGKGEKINTQYFESAIEARLFIYIEQKYVNGSENSLYHTLSM